MENLPFWSWWVLSCLLVGAELLTTSFSFLFFAVSALIVGMAHWAGLQDFNAQLVLFGVVGLAGLMFFRRTLVSRFQSKSTRWAKAPDVDEWAVVSSPIVAGGEGQGDYQGTVWTVVNESGRDLKTGERAKIARTVGVKLMVR